MDIFDTAEQISHAAEAMGYSIRQHVAETGSVYLDCARDRADGGIDELTVRVSTHGECYPPAAGVRQISVDPDGMTVDQAVDCLRDPARVAPEAPAARGPDELQLAHFREHNAKRRQLRENYQGLRASLDPADLAAFEAIPARQTEQRKRFAMDLADRIGRTRGLVFMALTNSDKAPKFPRRES